VQKAAPGIEMASAESSQRPETVACAGCDGCEGFADLDGDLLCAMILGSQRRSSSYAIGLPRAAKGRLRGVYLV
jgi:hypothetical protein